LTLPWMSLIKAGIAEKRNTVSQAQQFLIIKCHFTPNQKTLLCLVLVPLTFMHAHTYSMAMKFLE
jgi:hypothetical protein